MKAVLSLNAMSVKDVLSLNAMSVEAVLSLNATSKLFCLSMLCERFFVSQCYVKAM